MNIKIGREIFVAVFLVILLGILFVIFNNSAQNNVSNIFLFNQKLEELERTEKLIQDELLQHRLVLYRNYDLIENLLHKQKQNIATVLSSKIALSRNHQTTYNLLLKYKQNFQIREKQIQVFKSAAAQLKSANSMLSYILRDNELSLSQLDLPSFIQMSSLRSLLRVLRFRTGESPYKVLKQSVKKLETMKIHPQNKEIKELFLFHLSNFMDAYPNYDTLFELLANQTTSKKLATMMQNFSIESKKQLKYTSFFYVILMLGFVVSVGIIIYFLIYTEKEKEELTILKKQLEQFAYFNPITRLRNRTSFHKDIIWYKDPVCLLVNINHFKQINDFYGIDLGDYILKEFGKFLTNTVEEVCTNTALYHLGADEFAIVYDYDFLKKVNLEKEIVDALFFANKLKTYYANEIEIQIDFSIGISRGDKLLEKADMILKYIKKYTRLPYLEFDEDLNLQLIIETNLETIRLIRDALKKNYVVPFFQPIIDNQTGNIYKYECLTRVKNKEGTYSLPENFFAVAKETNYYREITIVMVEKCIQYFLHNDLSFSVNISVEDILDEKVNYHIERIFLEFPDVPHRLTFEILESEPIADYKVISDFIEKFRAWGCSFAIDDFGSGYANFNHLLGLKIDYIKIDGKLIRNLDKDSNAKMLVKTIVDFAMLANIKTVAEYVHSDKIYQLVKNLEVDFSQGFYLGRPKQLF